MIPSLPSRTGNRMAVASFLLSRTMIVICVVLLGMHWQIMRSMPPEAREGSTIVLAMQAGIVGVLTVSAIGMALGIAGLWGSTKKRTAIRGVVSGLVPFLLVGGSLLLWRALS